MAGGETLSQTAKNLLNAALAEGTFTQASLNVLAHNNLQATITNALGVDPNVITSSEVVLVARLLDDSGSMRHLVPEAVKGCNLMDASLKASKQSAGILMYERFLNGGQVYPFIDLAQAPAMDDATYRIQGATPLYREILATLGIIGAKVTDFSLAGVPARCVTVIVTDGANYDPTNTAQDTRQLRQDCKTVISDLLSQENHIVIAMGIDDGGTDFRDVFTEIGIPERWILTPDNTEAEVRKAFEVVSRSTVQASQTAGSFSQTALTGFTS